MAWVISCRSVPADVAFHSSSRAILISGFPMAHKLDNLYEELPIYILSTGTSLRGFDFTRLNGKITIGINRIIEYYHPSVLHFIDVTAQATHAKALCQY